VLVFALMGCAFDLRSLGRLLQDAGSLLDLVRTRWSRLEQAGCCRFLHMLAVVVIPTCSEVLAAIAYILRAHLM